MADQKPVVLVHINKDGSFDILQTRGVIAMVIDERQTMPLAVMLPPADQERQIMEIARHCPLVSDGTDLAEAAKVQFRRIKAEVAS